MDIQEKEEWRKVKDYEEYEVSNLGSVRSIKFKKPRLLRLANQKGYLSVTLHSKRKRKTAKVHRLVAEAFIENPNSLPEVNHRNEDKTDNRVQNLEWVTHEFNMKYGTRTNRMTDTMRELFGKKIVQLTKEGLVVGVWGSVGEIAKKMGWASGAICACARACNDTAYGYKWKYYDKYLDELIDKK